MSSDFQKRKKGKKRQKEKKRSLQEGRELASGHLILELAPGLRGSLTGLRELAFC